MVLKTARVKKFREGCLFLLMVFLAINADCEPFKTIYVHDPVMIRQDDTYYLFCTGWGISVFSSKDMKTWTYQGAVFEKAPSWAFEAVPEFKGHIWAPDIIYHNGKYFLYYSISSFAKNISCIGLATNTTLNPDDPEYRWDDQGIVIQSVPGRDLWNAIDPNVAFDDMGTPWLTFGSFWQGIKLVRLNSDMLHPDEPQHWATIAKRYRNPAIPDIDPGDGAIEAPFIFKKDAYYYLFVSFDYCCRGVKSDYKIMVGRSENITGPYIDYNGKDMFEGGGTLVLMGDERYSGVGHNAVCTFDGTDYLIFHAYDATEDGKPKLKIMELDWTEDLWPQAVIQQEIICNILK